MALGAAFFAETQTQAQAQTQTSVKPKVYAVSDAHFDSQWNWDVQTSIRDYVSKTLDQNLFLLARYPDYIFNFEGGVKYAWMKEYYPDQYEMVRKYVKEGRWHVTGSTWDAADANLPSPESFTRNILYGQQFFQREFGVRSTDIFLPDCFGFGWTLPTVAANAGLIGFSTQKLQWRSKPFYGNSKIPFEIGLWEGIDGSKIMLVADAHNYTTRWQDTDLSQNENLVKMAQASPLKTVYHYYGTGDTGGAPTIESVRAVEKGLKGDGPIQIISATSDQLYKDYLPYDKHPELPLYKGELLMDVHGTGCYTSEAAMKMYNRSNELLADAAERTAVVADWLGAQKYPTETFTEAWRRFIWHQFHDDLTGTSIPRAYEFSWNDELLSQKQFAQIWTSSVGAVARALNTQTSGTPLILENPVAKTVKNAVEITVANPRGAKDFTAYNEKGAAVPTQTLDAKDGKATLLVAAELPSVSFSVYDLRAGKPKASKALKAAARSLENSVYRLTVNDYGDVTSIIDKRTDKELVQSGKAVRLALFTENESFSWPAWEVLKKTIDQTPQSITDDVKITVAENGPVRAALCIEKKYGESVFRQYIRLTDGAQDDRIDFYNEIDWQSTNSLLKAEFPLSVANEQATYDLGVGSVKRGINTETAYEVYAHYWADQTAADGSYGVSVLNNAKYGWDKPDANTIRLTLLHTPKTQRGYTYQDKQDFGYHTFTYSIVGHQGALNETETVAKAEALNQTFKACIATDKHKGTLGKQFSFLTADNDAVIVKALKKAEDADAYIVRVYETAGKKASDFNLTFASEILEAKELNSVEDVKGNAKYSGSSLTGNITPFSMRTYSVRLKQPAAPLTAPRSLPIDLDYKLKAASFNAFRNEVNIDNKGYSYAAELLPETLEIKGITYKLGDPAAPNAIKCKGDTIILPQDGTFNRLYLLAASTYNDQKVEFLIDGKPVELYVPYYSGFAGQWRHTGHTEGFLKPADVAFIGTHRHSSIERKDMPYEYTYLFSFPIDIPKTAKQLILTDNSRILLFAATLAQTSNEAVTPATALVTSMLKPEDLADSLAFHRNLLTGKTITAMSGEFTQQQGQGQGQRRGYGGFGGGQGGGGKATAAIDNDFETSWTDMNSETDVKYLEFDLGKTETLSGWNVFHGYRFTPRQGSNAPANRNSMNFIAKDYRIEVRNQPTEAWKTVDEVTDNEAEETDRRLTQAVQARYVRFAVTKTEMNNNGVRISEINVY